MSGGAQTPRDVRAYQPPTGIKNQTKSVGLGSDNFGNGQTPSGASTSGSPGIGGTNHGNCGTQGKR